MLFAMAMLSIGLITTLVADAKPLTNRDLHAVALAMVIAIVDHSRRSKK
jgi:hypothetical protein